MTDAKPEALRLADWITGEEFYGSSDPFINDKMDEVKAELRRQHEEINALLNGASTHLKAALEIFRLQKMNQELVEALKCLTSQIFDQEIIIEWDDKQKALAALAKATGDKEWAH